MGGAAPNVTPWRTSATGGGVVAASAVAAWALAYPQNSLGDTAIRTIADVAAVVTLGLTVVPRFDEPRYRFEVASRATGPLIASSAVWAVAELVRLVLAAHRRPGRRSSGSTCARRSDSRSARWQADLD